jgi:hypothetical protein
MSTAAGARVLDRAQELVDRRRLVLGLCLAVAVALIAAIPGILMGGDSGTRGIRIAAGSTPPAGTVNPASTPAAVDQPTASSGTTTPGSPPSAAQVLGVSFTRPTSTTPLTLAVITGKARTTTSAAPKQVCHNSSDPSCGPRTWDPDPGPNQPLTADFTIVQAAPGAEVVFHITGSDPDDGQIAVCNYDYGDGGAVVCDPAQQMDPEHNCPKQYGPWTPPATKSGTFDDSSTYRHTYPHPGQYSVTFTLHSGSYCNSDPYASSMTVQHTIVVA